MQFTSKKTALFVLGVTATLCSKVLFMAFDDPEGANLLVTVGMALVVFFVSFGAYTQSRSIAGSKKLLLSIFVQILLTTILYFCLR